jgi:hypothetical protein
MLKLEGNWNIIHVDPEHPNSALWVTCLVSRQATEELGQFHLLGIPCDIVMLKHEVMVADEWHNNGPQDLVTVSL